MIALRVILDAETTPLKDTPDKYVVEEFTGPVVVAGMAKGTESGKPVVMIALDRGETVEVVQTTLSLFLTAADALKAKYGDPR